MKMHTKYILTCFLFLLLNVGALQAQTLTPEFQFRLKIIDSKGNSDTVVIGYDPLATDSMDTAFGEVGSGPFSPFDSLFEAKLGYYDSYFGGLTKRSIVYKQNAACVTGSGWYMAIPLLVRVKPGHFPINIVYDASLFAGPSCHDSTTLTPFPNHAPASAMSWVYFNLKTAGGSINISKYYSAYGPYYGYIDSTSAIIYTPSGGTTPGHVYIMAIYISTYDFINHLVLGIKDHQKPILESKVYPNPASGSVNVQIVEPAWCTITDISGKIIERTYLQAGKNTLDVSSYSKGLYYLRVENNNSRQNVHKLVVE